MTGSLDSEKRTWRDCSPRFNPTLRNNEERVSQCPPRVAILLSLLSWPEPGCPPYLKPVMVLVATAIWLSLAVLATRCGPLVGFWPILPIAAVFLLTSFVGGSLISMLAAFFFSLGLHWSLWSVQLPDLSQKMIVSGYRHKDFLMFLLFAWLCGVPHWRHRFSWVFTLVWGLGVVFSPVIYILINIYGFYGHLPEPAVTRYLNREFLMAWGLTVIVAAVLAKFLYFTKDFLRRTLT